MNLVAQNDKMARAGWVAGKMVARLLPSAKAASRAAASQFGPAGDRMGAGTAKQFVKHVIPATVKPIHALWHEVLGFIFLSFAGIGGFRIWQRAGQTPLTETILVGVFVLVMAGYGISSWRKARRISKS